MTAPRIPLIVALVGLVAAACAPRATTSTSSPSPTAAGGPVAIAGSASGDSTTSVAKVGRYRLTRSELMRPTMRDSIYRFTDGTPATVSVIRYDVPAFLKSEPDSQSWTTREGERFEEVQLVLMQQGRIQNFEKVFSTTRDVPVDDGMLREHAIAIAVRASGSTRMDFQYLYLVGGRFLKVRGTFPGDSWKTGEFPEFAREVARRTSRAARQ